MRIAFLGDTAFFGVFSTFKNRKEDVIKRLKHVKEKLENFDIVVANLETPLTNSKKECGGKSAYIKGIPEDVEFLKYLGVTHVTLANNHMFDFGEKGFWETIKTLEKAGIKYFGVNGKSCIERIDDNAISLHGLCCYSTNAIGYAEKRDFGINILDYEKTKHLLDSDKKNNLLSILSIHWGQEHVNYPNYIHMEFARKLAKDYVFLLHGHHPHVVQGVEKVNNSYIAYSLGNFCFDDVYTKKSKLPLIKLSENNKSSFIWSVEIKNNSVSDSKYIPIYIGEENQVYEMEKFENLMEKYSRFLNTDKFKYIKYREELLKKYLDSRKKMRNLKWFLKRLNYESYKMIVNAKNNLKSFDYHVADEVVEIKEIKKENVILFVGNFDIINLNASGRRILGVGSIFRNLGYEPIFVGVNKYVDNKVLNNYYIKDGFCTYSMKSSISIKDWLNVKRAYNNYVRVIEQIGREKIKYIYIYGSPVLSVYIAQLMKFAKKNGIQVIGDCVDWIEHTSNGKLRNLVKYIDTNYQKRYLLNKTSGMVVISSYLKQYYDKHNTKTILIPPVGEFTPVEKKIKNNLFNLIYSGIPFASIPNIEKNKMKDRLDLIINAIVELVEKGVDVILDIYGVTREQYLYSVPEHSKIIETYSSKIKFNGLVDNECIKEVIGNADATILIRDVTLVTMAGFPYKVGESLCLGTPVIANSTSDIVDYVKDGVNGIIINSDSKEAAEKIIECFIDDNKKEKIKQNCMENCVFDYKNFVSDMKDFLDRIK